MARGISTTYKLSALCAHANQRPSTRFGRISQVFGNVLETKVLERETRHDGSARVLLEQRCSWEFIVFRGSFLAELWVEEGANCDSLDFQLKDSSFMRTFRGCWELVSDAVSGSQSARCRFHGLESLSLSLGLESLCPWGLQHDCRRRSPMQSWGGARRRTWVGDGQPCGTPSR